MPLVNNVLQNGQLVRVRLPLVATLSIFFCRIDLRGPVASSGADRLTSARSSNSSVEKLPVPAARPYGGAARDSPTTLVLGPCEVRLIGLEYAQE